MPYTLIQRGPKGIHTAVWYEPDPKRPGQLRQRWKSTGTSKKSEAEKQAQHWSELGRTKRLGETFQKRTLELQRDLIGADSRMTSRAFLTDWFERQKTQVKDPTVEFYQSKVTLWLAWLSTHHLADADIALVRGKHVRDYLTRERQRVSAKTANHTLKFLRTIFTAAHADHLIIDKPTDKITPFPEDVEITPADKTVRKEKRRPFTITELEAVLGVCDPEWESMVMIGLHGSQRLKDNALMLREQVTLEDSEIFVIQSKTGKTVRPAIGNPLHAYLKKRGLPDDPKAPLHPRAYEIVTRTNRTAQLSTQFGDLLAEAGLREKIVRNPKADQRKGLDARRHTNALSYHCLRHTHISLMKRAGAPDSAVQDNSGHSDKETQKQYTHTDSSTRRRFANKMPTLRKH